MTINSHVWLVAGMAILLLCSEGKHSSAVVVGERSAGHEVGLDKCIQLAKRYVVEKKKWEEKDFRVVQENYELAFIGFSIQHEDDFRRSMTLGGLKSFHLDLDKSCNEVVRELKYQ